MPRFHDINSVLRYLETALADSRRQSVTKMLLDGVDAEQIEAFVADSTAAARIIVLEYAARLEALASEHALNLRTPGAEAN